MKIYRKIAILLILVLMVFALTACSMFDSFSSNDVSEEDLIGSWGCNSGSTTMVYTFERETNGTHTAVLAISKGYGTPEIYMFDSYEIDGNTVILSQNGKRISYEFSLNGNILVMDGITFNKF